MAKININASPDEIQQVVSSVMPPQIPSVPLPPPPPMPVPAQAGYKAFASDPLNQSAISKHITPPNTPILPPAPIPAAPPAWNLAQSSSIPSSVAAPQPWTPPASTPSSTILPPGMTPSSQPSQMASVNPPKPQMASANPPQVAPSPPPTLYGAASAASPAGAAPPSGIEMLPSYQSKLTADQTELQRQQKSGSGVSQIKNPWLRGLARFGDVAGSIIAPGIAAAIPGTTYHHDVVMGQQANRIGQDQGNIKDLLDQVNTQSQIDERAAAAKKANALGDADTPFIMSPLQAQAIGHPELSGTQATMRDYNRVLMGADRNTTTTNTNAATNATKVTTTGMNNNTSTANNSANNTTKETIADMTNKTKTLVASMHDATSRANNANTNDHKGSGANGSFKVPADVTKRAALGSNVLENANGVDDILKRRPDIVGSAGGRYTNVQQMIGSNDPDIQALGVRMHNIALASNGAHGVRAQQAIQKTEDELFSNFKAGPQAIEGALNATRASMQTFLDDEKNFSTTGQRTGGNNMVPPGGPTAEGATKTNSSGDKIAFRNGKWGPA